MTADEALVLEVYGDYGHFRKNYTTSSPLTHGFPPRTAVAGLLGAIGGLPNEGDESYQRMFSPTKSDIAVVLRNPVRKQRINKNMLKVKDETQRLTTLREPPESIERNQVPFEFLREPRFRIYFRLDNDGEMERFESLLEEGKSVYTPYLGISELIAEHDYIGRVGLKERSGTAQIDSVVNKGIHSPVFEKGKRYQRENASMAMDNDRVVQTFSDVIYESTGDSIRVNDVDYYEVSDTGNKITFFLQ